MTAGRVAAVAIDVLLVASLGVSLFVGATGGGVYSIAGEIVSITRSGNPLAVFTLFAMVRVLWLGNVPLPGTDARPRQLADRLARSIFHFLNAGAAIPAGVAVRWVTVIVAFTFILRALNAWLHPGFVTGDDVELHEMTFKTLFDGEWPIWDLRNAFYPMAFLYPAQALSRRLGLDDPRQLVFAARLVVVIIVTLTPVLVYAVSLRLTTNRAAALIATALFAGSRMFLWFGSSEFPRPVAAVFVTLAFYLLLDRQATLRAAGAGGVLIGVAGALRFSEFLFVVPAGVQLAFARRWRDAIVLGGAAAAAGAVLLGISDWLYWGSPFHSLNEMVGHTLVRGEAARGFQPALWYLTSMIEWTTPVIVALSLFSLTGPERRPALWAWTGIVLLSLLPHKEPRYLVPLYPLLCISAALGLAAVANGAGPRLRTMTVLLLSIATLFEVTSWRVRRTDDAVRLARDIQEQLRPGSIAASQMWRFGGPIYWRGIPVRIALPETALEAPPDADVVVLLQRETNAQDEATLTRGGFEASPLGRGSEYLVFVRPSRPPERPETLR